MEYSKLPIYLSNRSGQSIEQIQNKIIPQISHIISIGALFLLVPCILSILQSQFLIFPQLTLNIHFSKTLKTMFRISHLNFGHSVEATYNEIGQSVTIQFRMYVCLLYVHWENYSHNLLQPTNLQVSAINDMSAIAIKTRIVCRYTLVLIL